MKKRKIITPLLLPFHEIIGLHAKVVYSQNPCEIGIEGKIIDETKNFININGKLIKKKDCILLLELPDGTKLLISGNLLIGHPVERTKHFQEAEKYAKRSFRI